MTIAATPVEEEAALKAKIERSRIKLTAVAVVCVLAVNAALGLFLYNTLVVDVEAKQLQQLTQQNANSQAAAVARSLTDLRRELHALAQQPSLRGAIAAADIEGLAAIGRDYVSVNSDTLALRFFPIGTAAIDREHAYPIRFAELDMIHHAEKGEKVKAEANKIDGDWLLYSAVAVNDGAETIIGSGLVVTAISPLQSVLAATDSELGQSELLQSFNPQKPDVILQHGSANHATTALAPVSNSHWQVRFTPSPVLVAEANVSPVITIAITALSTIILLALSILAARYVAEQQLHRQLRAVLVARSTAKGRASTGQAHPISQDKSVQGVTVSAEDEDILGLNSSAEVEVAKAPSMGSNAADIPENIFRSYDIRGLANTEISVELATKIGRALASEALDQGESSLVVGRDARLSSPELCQALIEGILACGCDVINIGVVPSPLMYFATHHLHATSSGVMVTASHNPAEYNGFKMIINGVTLADQAVTDVRTRIVRGQFHSGQGNETTQDIMPDYIDRILADVALAGDVHVVVDAGNGATSEAGPVLFEELGCDVTKLYCEFDGSFPNHQPDPGRSENLQDLIAKVKEVDADIGVAFDGDGDRLVVVTKSGRIIWPDQLLMLFARDIVSSNPGADVLFDVKSTRLLNQVVSSCGGRPIMWKTGHSHMKAKMIETGALLGGEFSGHIFIKHRWYGFDDGIYACARLLEIMTLRDQGLDELMEVFPAQISTEEILVPVSDARKFSLVSDLIASAEFEQGEHTTIDGLRVDFAKGWGLVRASNTSAALTLRFEADSVEALQQIQALFKAELLKVEASLKLDF